MWTRPHSCVTMSVSTQQLAEEMQIFGLEYEEPLIEKCESLAPSLDPRRGPRLACNSQTPKKMRALLGFTFPRSDFSVGVRCRIKLSFEFWDVRTLKCSQSIAWTPTQK